MQWKTFQKAPAVQDCTTSHSKENAAKQGVVKWFGHRDKMNYGTLTLEADRTRKKSDGVEGERKEQTKFWVLSAWTLQRVKRLHWIEKICYTRGNMLLLDWTRLYEATGETMKVFGAELQLPFAINTHVLYGERLLHSYCPVFFTLYICTIFTPMSVYTHTHSNCGFDALYMTPR